MGRGGRGWKNVAGDSGNNFGEKKKKARVRDGCRGEADKGMKERAIWRVERLRKRETRRKRVMGHLGKGGEMEKKSER